MENKDGYININKQIISSFEAINDSLTDLFQKCAANMNEVNIHDLRVIIRRTLAFTRFINKLYSSNYYPELKTVLKQVLKGLNPLRDAQVQILKLKKNITPDSVMMDFFFYLLKQERELLISNKKLLTKTLLNDLNGLLFFILMDIKSQLRDDADRLDTIIENAEFVYLLLKDTLALTSFDDLDSLHKLRLAFKKYRYTIDVLQRLLQTDSNNYRYLKKIQNLLGAIQDNNVLVKKLDEFIASSPQSINECRKFRDRIIEQRSVLIETLRKNVGLIDKVNVRLFLTQR